MTLAQKRLTFSTMVKVICKPYNPQNLYKPPKLKVTYAATGVSVFGLAVKASELRAVPATAIALGFRSGVLFGVP